MLHYVYVAHLFITSCRRGKKNDIILAFSGNNVGTEFCESLSTGSEVEIGDTQEVWSSHNLPLPYEEK